MNGLELFEKVSRDMRSGVLDFTDNGKCSQCGECCSNLLPMSGKEIKEIHWYIKKHRILELKHGIPNNDKKLIDLTCPFLDENKPAEKCAIYPVRPEICRSFTCCKAERDKQDVRWAFRKRSTLKLVNVREEFFG